MRQRFCLPALQLQASVPTQLHHRQVWLSAPDSCKRYCCLAVYSGTQHMKVDWRLDALIPFSVFTEIELELEAHLENGQYAPVGLVCSTVAKPCTGPSGSSPRSKHRQQQDHPEKKSHTAVMRAVQTAKVSAPQLSPRCANTQQAQMQQITTMRELCEERGHGVMLVRGGQLTAQGRWTWRSSALESG